jgi:hypothetical protein
MTCISLPSFLLSPQAFICLYLLFVACAIPAVCSSYASGQNSLFYKINLWEQIGCAIVAAFWPVLIVVRIFLLGVQFFRWVLPY